jgi:hypothetical protein
VEVTNALWPTHASSLVGAQSRRAMDDGTHDCCRCVTDPDGRQWVDDSSSRYCSAIAGGSEADSALRGTVVGQRTGRRRPSYVSIGLMLVRAVDIYAEHSIKYHNRHGVGVGEPDRLKRAGRNESPGRGEGISVAGPSKGLDRDRQRTGGAFAALVLQSSAGRSRGNQLALLSDEPCGRRATPAAVKLLRRPRQSGWTSPRVGRQAEPRGAAPAGRTRVCWVRILMTAGRSTSQPCRG